MGDAIEVRLVTAETAKQDRTSLPTFPISVHATIQELHERAAHHLELSATFDEATLRNECNCTLAQQIADCSQLLSSGFYAVYGKSIVCQISVVTRSKVGVDMALADHFGADLEDRKKLHFLGGETGPAGQYVKTPVVSICSKDRHIPPHARVTELADDSSEARS